MENALAEAERTKSMIEYMAVCDYPELLEEMEGAEEVQE